MTIPDPMEIGKTLDIKPHSEKPQDKLAPANVPGQNGRSTCPNAPEAATQADSGHMFLVT
jgi:hypothetical protein